MTTSVKSCVRMFSAPTVSNAVIGEVSETTIIPRKATRRRASPHQVPWRHSEWGSGDCRVRGGSPIGTDAQPPPTVRVLSLRQHTDRWPDEEPWTQGKGAPQGFQVELNPYRDHARNRPLIQAGPEQGWSFFL